MKLVHRDLGGDGLPPLVILHGLLGSSRNWQSAGRDLAPHHHVIAIDLRNHGSSPHAVSSGYVEMMEDVLAFIADMKIEAADFIGHSLGGKVAMLLACRHPAVVRSLVVVDIAPKDYLSRAHRAEFAAMQELDLFALKSRGEAEMRMEGRVPDWAMRKFLTTNLECNAEGSWRWIVNLPVLSEALPAFEKTPLDENDHYAGKVLFIAGEKSRYILPEDHGAIRRHFSAAGIVTIAGAGHNPHMETRELFVEAVENFFVRIE